MAVNSLISCGSLAEAEAEAEAEAAWHVASAEPATCSQQPAARNLQHATRGGQAATCKPVPSMPATRQPT